MGLHTATGLKRWVERAEEKTLHASRLNIGPRLILGFVFIILSMLVADAVVLWQFHLVRTQAERLNGIDQKLVAVLRVHTSLLAFHDRLEELADSQDVGRLVTEGGPLRTAVLEDTRRAMSALTLMPFALQRDPTILPTLHAVQSALPSQLEAISTLATSGDWRAVRLRLANQVTPLESLTSALVENVDREVGEEQAQTVLNIRRVQRLVFLVVPLTALLTLLIAATLGLAITRSITQPLARLVEGSEALARGEFQHQVAVSGNDELAHLGQVFNDTARRLRDLYTEQRRAEEALRQAQSDLAHVSRVTTMGELTASLAHEVNQPIAAAVTNANTCLRWLAADTPNLEEARAAANRIVKDGRRAGEIISRIRLLFKKGAAERELVDMNEVIREMIVLLSSEAMRYNVSVRTQLAADLPQVMGDRVQLQQVVMNLMINGIDAMKDVGATRELIINSQRGENERLLVSVSDTGVGLPPQYADQIFNAFFTTKPHGTGMGLRISRSIIESHGGRLWAADNSSHGASFYFALPKVEAHE